jgi:predicted kinase
MAAGKSTVAQRLAERLPNSVHLRGDTFRRMIVNGRAEMGADLAPEARAQLCLRYRIAVAAAGLYLAAGFSVVYQDIILGADLAEIAQALRHHPLHVIVLCPSVEAVAAREAARSKTGYGTLPIAAFDRFLRADTPRLGLWLDTSEQTADETVDHILAHLSRARVREAPSSPGA